MKQILYLTSLLLFFVALDGCKKSVEPTPVTPTPTPTPTPVPFAGCRVTLADETTSDRLKIAYGYTTDGFIDNIVFTYPDNPHLGMGTAVFSYSNGVPISLTNPPNATGFETYEYKNGALSKLTIIKSPIQGQAGYQIDFTTDVSKRITSMVDSDGNRTDLTRDANGNVTEITRQKVIDKTITFQMQLSDFDGKKSLYSLFKGWAFNFSEDTGNYMTYGPLLNDGAGGNPRSVRTLNANLEYRYTYSADGYPTSLVVIDKATGKPISTGEYTLSGCK